MRPDLSEQQAAIYDMALEFGRRKLAPHALDWDEKKFFPIDVMRDAATLGMGGICIGDDVGGSSLGRVDAVLIFEALSISDPSIAAFISIHNMVAWMIDRFGDDAQRRTYLPELCSMAKLGSYCLTEADAGSDAAALTTTSKRQGDDYTIHGAKQFISGAGSSDIYIVMARTGEPGPDGISAFILNKEMLGISFGANERKMGWNAQPTRAVIFDGVRVPASHRLGIEGEGFKIAMAGLDGGRLNIGACSIGGAQGALDKAVAYMKERRAFGKALADFQALQFRLADMETELSAARLLLHAAAAAYDRGDPSITAQCAMAKRLATDAGFNVANAALQLHGGYGYLSETGIEKIVRDLRVHQILEGTNEIMRLIISRALLK